MGSGVEGFGVCGFRVGCLGCCKRFGKVDVLV